MSEPSVDFDWADVIDDEQDTLRTFVHHLMEWLVQDGKNPAFVSGRVHAVIYTFGFAPDTIQEIADRSWVSKPTMQRFINELTKMEGMPSKRRQRARSGQ